MSTKTDPTVPPRIGMVVQFPGAERCHVYSVGEDLHGNPVPGAVRFHVEYQGRFAGQPCCVDGDTWARIVTGRGGVVVEDGEG